MGLRFLVGKLTLSEGGNLVDEGGPAGASNCEGEPL